jgi:hypothetical protein
MTPSGIDPATFRIVTQCLKQLRHRQELACIRTNSLQSPSSVQANHEILNCTSLCDHVHGRTLLYDLASQAELSVPQSINQSYLRYHKTLQRQSHTGATPEAFSSGQNSVRSVLSVTRETAFYGSARTSGLNLSDKSSSDYRGWRFLYKTAHWSDSISTIGQLYRVIIKSLCT